MNFTSSKLSITLTIALVLSLPMLGMLSTGSHREWFILLYEQACAACMLFALATALHKLASPWKQVPLIILLSTCFMTVGDACTSITELTGGGQHSLPVSIGLPSYFLFALGSVVAVKDRYWPKITPLAATLLLTSFVALAALQFGYVLSPLRHSSELLPLVKMSYVSYRFAECASIVLLIPIIVRIDDYMEHAFLQGLLLVHMAGFAISYNNAHGSGQAHAWPAWPIALGTMAAALWADRRRQKSMFSRNPVLCSPISIRAGIGSLVLVVNLLLLLFLMSADVFAVMSGTGLTYILLAIFACVSLTSVMAQVLSRKIESLSSEMALQRTHRDTHKPIKRNALLAEINNLITGYNRLVEESNATSGTLAKTSKAGVSNGTLYQAAHDIRSPLAALRVVEAGSHDLPEDSRDLMRSAIERINSMVESLLEDYRSGTSSHIVEKTEKQDLCALVEAVWREKKIVFAERRVALSLTCDPAAKPTFVTVKADRLQRSIANLVQNAYEACDEGGNVVISVGRTTTAVTIDIVDDGQGIEPENIATVMQAGGTMGKSNGCGMGLSSARDFFEGAGGSLMISSQPQVGTRVTGLLLLH